MTPGLAMLASALDHYRRQQRITAMGVREARRRATRGPVAVAGIVGAYQVASASLSFEKAADEIAEQGLEAPAQGRPIPPALITTGAATVEMLNKAATNAAFDRLVATLMQDAGRTASTVDLGSRPALTGYVRALNPPSCPRCAVLAGRVYRRSTGFQRHPGCDCIMQPTTQELGRELITDPQAAFNRGQIRGLSKGDTEALEAGADMGQVVNVRRSAAGLTVGSSVVERGGRMTPQGIMRVASDDAQRLDLLRRFGYLG